jgi:hypothetical protein
MKKKQLALLGFAALAGVALASCGKKENKTSGGQTTGTGTVDPTPATPDAGKSFCVWDPISYDQAKSKYKVNGTIDAWIVYNKNFGITYNANNKIKDLLNPITNEELQSGEVLPAWKAFTKNLGLTEIKQACAISGDNKANNDLFKNSKNSDGAYIGTQEGSGLIDVYFNSTANLNDLGRADQLVDLKAEIDKGNMPALEKFLKDNPAVATEITTGGKIFYTPYMDGYQAIERMLVVDAEQIEKLLDKELPEGTGNLVAGKAAESTSKGLKGEAKLQSYVAVNGKNYKDAETTIDIVDPATTNKVQVKVKQTDDIISQQNKLLNTTDGSATGKKLIEQFKAYIDAAYGDIITEKFDGKRSKIFTSIGACYNSDDFMALMRVFKANPDVLYGSAEEGKYDEVVPLFPRGPQDNRIESLLNFGATLFGVQGRGSEKDHLFIGSDKKFHDFDTAQASYDMLDYMHGMYAEGLIEANFWASATGKNENAVKRYFYKNQKDQSTYGLVTYDYTATQSAANDYKDGIGTKPADRSTSPSGISFADQSVQGVQSILSPLTFVPTESYAWDQALTDKTGKTLTRYYEENRSVKDTSWAIPVSSDNKDSAIALLDYMFTKEGWEVQNFGPAGYWDEGKVLGETMPVIKQTVLEHFSKSGKGFWDYCRGYLGTTWAIGHYRPTGLDYQATNYYTKESYTNLTRACAVEVQNFSIASAVPQEWTWKSSMPMAAFTTEDQTVSNKYIGVTNFWGQEGKLTTGGTVGWVAIVVNGSDYTGDVLTGQTGDKTTYTYADVKEQREIKNTSYLYNIGATFTSGEFSMIAPEAFTKQ